MESDYLTCGQCLKEFPLQRITLFIQHKKLDCDEDTGNQFEDTDLKCYYCPRGFMSAWGLLVHVQLTHSLRIFVERTTLSRTTNRSKAVAVNEQTEGILVRKTIIEKENSGTYDNKECGMVSGKPSLDSTGTDTIDSDIMEIENKNMLCGNPDDFSKIKNEIRNATEKSESILLKNYFNLNGSTDAMVGNTNILMGKDVSSQSEDIHTSGLIISHSEERVKSQKTLLTTFTSPVISIRKDSHETVSSPSSLSQNSSPPGKSVQETPATMTDTAGSILSQATQNSLPQSVKFLQENISRNPVHVCDNSDAIQRTNTQNSTVSNNLVTLQKTNTHNPTVISDDHVATQRTNNTQNPSNHRLDEGNRMDGVEPGNTSGDTDETNLDCCDNQGCGITVIPGSHLDLQKCCNAVLPKKRKLHMEMKHMPFSWSSSRYARRRMLQRSLASVAKSTATGTSTIFIDVEPDSFIEPDKNQNTESHRGASIGMPTSDTSPDTQDSKRVPRLFPIGTESRTKSLILKPGAVFSIPFSYSIPNSVSGTSTSIPISIIQAQSGGKQVYSSSFSNRKLVPISTQKLSQGQIQVSRLETGNNGGSEGEIIIEDADFRRRKYPTSKPFQCDKCSMAFNQRIHLKKHMSKHTGIKPYKCGECDYSTVERSHLKVHIRIHTGEKPFKCTYCEYATAQNSTLKIHLKRHHGGKMFACQSCEKTFTQIEQLKGHVTDHPEVPVPSTPLKMKQPENDSNLLIDEHEKQSPDKEVIGEHESIKEVEPLTSNVDLGHVLSIP